MSSPTSKRTSISSKRRSDPLADASREIFDISKTYQNLLSSPPYLPPALAAISALTAALSIAPLRTTSETLSLLSDLTAALKASVGRAAAVRLSAGTEAFQRYIATTLARPGASTAGAPSHAAGDESSFAATKASVVSAGQAFVTRGIDASKALAPAALPGLACVGTVVVPAYAPAVEAALLALAAAKRADEPPPSPADADEGFEDAAPQFRALLVAASGAAREGPHADRQRGLAAKLRAHGVQAVLVAPESLAYALLTSDACPPPAAARDVDVGAGHGDTVVLAAAEALLADGGAVAGRGTLQAALLARALSTAGAGVGAGRIKVLVLAELFRAVRWMPLDGAEIGDVLGPAWARADTGAESGAGAGAGAGAAGADGSERAQMAFEDAEAMDVTPPELITAIITERGWLSPSQVAEEAVRTWF